MNLMYKYKLILSPVPSTRPDQDLMRFQVQVETFYLTKVKTFGMNVTTVGCNR